MFSNTVSIIISDFIHNYLQKHHSGIWKINVKGQLIFCFTEKDLMSVCLK